MNRISALKASELAAAYKIETLCHIFPWSQALFYSSQGSKYCNYKICVANTLAGFCIIHRVVDEASLYNIAIHPRYQNQGLAKMLLTYAEEQLRMKGIKTLWLEVRASNHAARTLYDQCGFNSITIRTKYYQTKDGNREDAIIMAKQLIFTLQGKK